jgi:hypothetical protein
LADKAGFPVSASAYPPESPGIAGLFAGDRTSPDWLECVADDAVAANWSHHREFPAIRENNRVFGKMSIRCGASRRMKKIENHLEKQMPGLSRQTIADTLALRVCADPGPDPGRASARPRCPPRIWHNWFSERLSRFSETLLDL